MFLHGWTEVVKKKMLIIKYWTPDMKKEFSENFMLGKTNTKKTEKTEKEM